MHRIKLPNFTHLLPENIDPPKILKDFEAVITKCEKDLQKILEEKIHTWDSLMSELDKIEDRIHQFWAPIEHLHQCMDSDELRNVYEGCLPKMEEFQLKVFQDENLYNAMKSIKENKEYLTLSPAKQKVIQDKLKSFERLGVLLKPEQKKRFIDLRKELSKLYTTFDNNIKDEYANWFYYTKDKTELDGLPDFILKKAKQLASEKGKSGWRFTLADANTILRSAKNRDLRDKVCRAFFSAASNQFPGGGRYDNAEIIDEIMKIRHEITVDLLEYKNFSEYALEKTMAKTPEIALETITRIIDSLKPIAQNEFKQLELEDKEKLELHDLAYSIELLKQKKCSNMSQESSRPYFPLNHVLKGLFETLQELFSISIEKQEDEKSYAKDVNVYHVYDEKNQLRGSFYLDLYAKPNKLQIGHNYVLSHGCQMSPIRTHRLSP